MSTLSCQRIVILNLFQCLMTEGMPKQVRHDVVTRVGWHETRPFYPLF